MKSPSLVLLGRRHRQMLWMRPVYIAGAGLLLVLLLGWAGVAPGLQLSVLSVFASLALAARVWPRRTLGDAARALDAKVAAYNRFEAVAELGGRTDPFAHALRAEVDDYVARYPLPRPDAWFTALALCAVLLAANLTLLGPGWVQGIGTPNVVAAAAAATPEPVKPPVPTATLRWVTPSEEISAAATEEVPLTAEAESAAGLRKLSLHVTRNGEPLLPIAVLEEIAAGTQLVPSVLRLEALSLQPFDVVTYFLRAERIRPKDIQADPPWTPISSPLQFVQIESRAEPLEGVCSECAAGCLLDVVRRLKREQLGVLRDTVAAAHDTAPRSDPGWRDLVRAVETRESAIRQETAGLVAALAEAGIGGDAATALTQAEKETGLAAADLRRVEPNAAIDPAGRALARFAAAEKALARNVITNRRREKSPPEPSDLPARETTPAGRLEKLAAEQAKVVEQLVARTAPPGILTEQDRLAHEIEKLAAERVLPGEITGHVKAAAEAAKEAARHLNEQDVLAATEPATRAAQELGEAVSRLLATASVRAVDDLLAAQRSLIHAATDLRMAAPADTAEAAKTAAERVERIRQDARAAAGHQQRQGSAAAAQRLNELAKAIARSGVQKDLAKLEQSGSAAAEPQNQQQKETAAGKLHHLAQGAVDGAAGLEDVAKMQERAIDELRRTQSNLARAAKRESTDLGKNVGRDATGIVDFYEKALAQAQRLANVDQRERAVPPPPGPGSTVRELEDYAAALSLRIAGLIRLATAPPRDAGRSQLLTLGNPSDAPPAYRPAVADYFESLARERAATAAAPKQ